MPWYITLSITILLFLLAPFFRKWVDLVIWPRIADWWASRSQEKLKTRIAKLEARLLRISSLSPLTDFEDFILWTLMGLVTLLVMVPLFGVTILAWSGLVDKVLSDRYLPILVLGFVLTYT